MYNTDTELIFPMRVIKELEHLRGEDWQKFVYKISSNETDDIDKLGFVFFMVKTAGCTTCNADAFRAMKGCTQCAMQSVRRYRGEDQELIQQYLDAREEVRHYIKKKEINL